MKKLLSAATSLCMAATMLTAVVPASVAADDTDTTKGMSLRIVDMDTLKDKGASYTISAADIAAGDVTVTCGLYMEEGSQNNAGVIATYSVDYNNLPDGADADSISIAPAEGETGATSPAELWFNTAQSYTTSDGTAFTSKYIPTYTGTIRRNAFSPNATQLMITTDDEMPTEDDDGHSVYNTITYNWISMNGSPWIGSTSDEYPMMYFNVTLKQGAAAGEYAVVFQDYWKNEQHTQRSCQIGSQVTNQFFRTVDVNNSLPLTLTGLTITVEGDEETPAATTTAVATTTAPTTTTTAKVDNSNSDATINLTWAYEDGLDYYVATPGETLYADLMIDSNGNGVISADMGFNLDSPLTINEIFDSSEAFGTGLTVNWVGNKNAAATPVDLNGNAISGKFNGVFGKEQGTGDDKTYEPIVPSADEIFATFELNVPSDIEDGIYYLSIAYAKFGKIQDVDYDSSDISYVDCVIRVGDADVVATTTTTAATTTTKATTTTTTAAATTTKAATTTTAAATTTTAATTTAAPTAAPDVTVEAGSRLLGDTNCDGKVNVADVVILNKYISGNGDLMKDQGKINGEVTNPTLKLSEVDLTADDSTYIIQSIIHLWTLTEDGPVATEYNK